jgi:hypothetical protein
MKSPLEAPEKQIAEETSAKSASRTDSSGGEIDNHLPRRIVAFFM